MEAEEKDINIALLIDADNISAKYISAILSELSRYGKITIRRMYGDWTQERLRSWFNQAAKYSLTPIMQPNNTPGKNASDIGLIIDAMDILYEGKVQGFCIVSSDGDFNRLATRLREAGMTVIGMGEKKTPEAFQRRRRRRKRQRRRRRRKRQRRRRRRKRQRPRHSLPFRSFRQLLPPRRVTMRMPASRRSPTSRRRSSR